ncbi:MAG: DUF1232 domain-containing protein [Clostridia bacterium]|nr:DUF1232 domain-containing protein [Clostridia bacterium]
MNINHEEILNRFKQKATDYFENPKKLENLLSEANKKAQNNSGPFDEIWNKLQLMFSMIKDWMNGSYREVPTGSIIAIIAGLIYLVNPLDLIPDYIPVAGLVDDIAILGLIIKQISSDLDKYEEWKKQNEV